MKKTVEEGDKAPDFTLPADDGTRIRLADMAGHPVVLYFYPRDNTPGCTRQAAGFRDAYPEFQAAGAVVLGVSPDGVASHARFRDRHDLNFRLLADPDHSVAQLYGVWREKKMFGVPKMGIERSTFLVAPSGRLAKVWRKVKVDGHVQEVLAALSSLVQATQDPPTP
ncbi:MAG: thioredoxin-dependent thiol peroxidase [Candidatus Xenobium sp.]|jgi:peroxiredoxin Q/BCP|nr:thioredoxin-dependent thiol peroxidase [Burkholderiales bacterium]